MPAIKNKKATPAEKRNSLFFRYSLYSFDKIRMPLLYHILFQKSILLHRQVVIKNFSH